MERPFRKLRMASAIASLLVSLEGTYELVTDSLLPLIKDGKGFTAYGWGVIVAIAARVAVTGALVWALARIGGTKPLPFSRRSDAGTLPPERPLVTASPSRSDR